MNSEKKHYEHQKNYYAAWAEIYNLLLREANGQPVPQLAGQIWEQIQKLPADTLQKPTDTESRILEYWLERITTEYEESGTL